jgi:hypothetical protein
MPIFSVTKFSETEVNREKRKYNKKYNSGLVDIKNPNMENIFIKHIFNTEWRKNHYHENACFSTKMLVSSDYELEQIRTISLETLANRKFLMYVYVLAHQIPLPKPLFTGRFSDFIKDGSKMKNIVIKKDTGRDSAFTLCLDNDSNIYDDDRELSWRCKKDIHSEELVIVEELLKNKSRIQGSLKMSEVGLVAYHLYSFDGNVRYINIMTRNKERDIENCYWYDLYYKMGMNENIDYNIFPSDKEMEKMLDYSRRLRFNVPIFMRVTFYITEKGIKFGDFTFQPSNFFRGWKLLRMDVNIIDLFAIEIEQHGIYLI